MRLGRREKEYLIEMNQQYGAFELVHGHIRWYAELEYGTRVNWAVIRRLADKGLVKVRGGISLSTVWSEPMLTEKGKAVADKLEQGDKEK